MSPGSSLRPSSEGHFSRFWRWQPMLDIPAFRSPPTLGEGGTPLLRANLFRGCQLWWKDETRNPTGSHKDRALALAVADASERNARIVAVYSAGSTGLSCAAYCARAGLQCVVFMSAGTPRGRVEPLRQYGAHLVEVDAPIDEGLAALDAAAGIEGLYIASTTRAANAVQAVAARTIAYEIVEDLGHAPDQVVIPVGGGGTIAALHDGFVALRNAGEIATLPRLIGVVPSTYDTLARAFELGVRDREAFNAMPPPAGGPTILNKIAHDHPPDGVFALEAIAESSGRILSFGDDEALAEVAEIGRAEGLFLEPSSAILGCALRVLHNEGELGANRCTVAIACGSGFRETHVMLDRPLPAPVRIGVDGVAGLLHKLCLRGS